MIKRIIAWVKSHPLLTGGLAILAIVLYMVVRRAGSGGGTSTGTNTAATLQAYALQTQRMQVEGQATVAGQQIAGALAAKQADVTTQLGIAQLAAGVENAKTEMQKTVEVNYVEYMRQRDASAIMAQVHAIDVQGQIEAAKVDVQSKAIDMQRILGLAQNASYERVNLASIDASKTVALDTNAKQLAAVYSNNYTAIDLANIAAVVENKKTDAAVTLGLNNNATALAINNNKTVVDLANISAWKDVNIFNAGVYQNLGLSALQTTEAIANINATALMNLSNADFGLRSLALTKIGSGLGSTDVQALSTIFNVPAVGVASAGSDASQAASSASMWSNITRSITGGLVGLFGA